MRFRAQLFGCLGGFCLLMVCGSCFVLSTISSNTTTVQTKDSGSSSASLSFLIGAVGVIIFGTLADRNRKALKRQEEYANNWS